ncbi:MAG: tail fiber protein, partial [Cyclobacteriaceae bacterium]|nr:tail fiber protein [Cyclobacteriaceae bacterium]
PAHTYMTINQGNVGIGVNPAHKLHVRAVDEISSALRLDAGKFSMGGSARFEIDAVGIVGGRFLVSENGNIGLGTITPDAKLDVFANNPNADNLILSANYSEQYRWRFRTIDRGNAIDLDITASDGNDIQETVLKLSRSNSGRPEFALNENWLVANNGNVGIGTTNPTEKLTVNGNVYSKEVKVDVNAGTGPDYVFEPTYQLPSLTEIENYIKANKHLPEVPSAKEMETNGINLSEMNMLLLKKVEELTLHLIEANKKIDYLTKRIDEKN